MVIWITVALGLVVADQIIKYIVVENIALTQMIEVIPNVLNFAYVKNTGAAFSILSGKTDLLGLISFVVCALIVAYLLKKKPENKLFLLSLGTILGGAVGNMIDRILKGYVVDYIELAFINFPVFNLADIAITVGAVLLMIYVIFFDEKQEEKKDKK